MLNNVQLGGSGADGVAFLYLYHENEADAAADDTLDTIAANLSAIGITPQAGNSGAFGAGVGLTFLNFTGVAGLPYTAALGGATFAQVNTIAGLAAVQALIVPIENFAGGVLDSAQTVSLLAGGGTDLKLTVDVELDALTDNDVTIGTLGQLVINTTPPVADPALIRVNGNVAAGAMVARFDEDSMAFVGTLDTVTIPPFGNPNCDAAENLRDRAGNCLAAVSNFPVTAFAPPAFAGNSADLIATAGTCIDAEAEITAFHSATGNLCAAGETVVLTGTLAEALDGTGLDDNLDIIFEANGTDLEPILTGLPACVASATCVFTLTFAGGDDTVRVNPTTGQVELAADNGAPVEADFDPITGALDISDVGDEPTTGEAIALAAATAAENTFTSLRNAPLFVTVDQFGGTSDGELDGVDIQLQQELDPTLGNNVGTNLVDAIMPFDPINSDVALAADANGLNTIVRVTAADTQDLRDISDDPADLLTDATLASVPPIPYSVRILDSTIMYTQVFDAATGELDFIPDQIVNPAIADGAAPIIVSAEFLATRGGDQSMLMVTASERVSTS